jgi:hypothetical protein
MFGRNSKAKCKHKKFNKNKKFTLFSMEYSISIEENLN